MITYSEAPIGRKVAEKGEIVGLCLMCLFWFCSIGRSREGRREEGDGGRGTLWDRGAVVTAIVPEDAACTGDQRPTSALIVVLRRSVNPSSIPGK